MGNFDVFDQVRTGPYGTDIEARTNKWAVRFHEIMWSFLVAQSYNMYSHLYKDDRGVLHNHVFTSNLAMALIQKPWDRTHLGDSAGLAGRGHKIKQIVQHSRLRACNSRRLSDRCRNCPNMT